MITSSETIRASGKQKRRRLLTIALTAAVAAGAIGFVALKWGQNGPYAYRHQVQLWPNPDPIDGSGLNQIYPIEFSPDGRVAMAKDNRDRILILDPSTGQITRIVSGGGDNLVDSLAFAKDGRSIVSAGAIGQVNAGRCHGRFAPDISAFRKDSRGRTQRKCDGNDLSLQRGPHFPEWQ